VVGAPEANGGDLPVLVVEGEMLLGAKQDRTLNLSVLCPPKARVPIPVSCVDAPLNGSA
jgi:hypothetical protein